MNWDERFNLAKAYYEYHGNLKIVISFKTKNGYAYDADGFELGRWISRQRHQYKIKQLTQEHYEKLKSIGMVFDDLNIFYWDEFYDFACIYLEKHGDLMIKRDFRTINGYERDENGKSLGAWFHVQRRWYALGQLPEERQKKMDILFKRLEEKQKQEWTNCYILATAYYKHYGNLNISKHFKTTNGYESDVNGLELGKWIFKQRELYQSGLLSMEQIEKLQQIQMNFGKVAPAEWKRMYDLAEAYYKHYGNLQVHRTFKTKNGIDFDNNGSRLGLWINTQYTRQTNGSMTQEQYEKLFSIGMNFENQRENNWQKMYALAKAYYEHHHNLDVPADFRTLDGYTFNENGEFLKAWINDRRKYFRQGKLSKVHIEQLKAIGMTFDSPFDIDWEKMYQLAENYYKHYGNLHISVQFKTQNGYEYDENGFQLGSWITRQRISYQENRLSAERTNKLKSIGMVFENLHDVAWEKMYQLCQKYYMKHRHLKVACKFKTKNGYEYDANGAKLGQWLTFQKACYKNGTLNQERIEKLLALGMIFEPRKNRADNCELCERYNIQYSLYKKQIDAIPYREFLAKINYLCSEDMPILIGEQLHPIFFESSINMQVKYGVNLEQLIELHTPTTAKTKRR